MKIQHFINNRNKYQVDTTYQRPNDVWSNEDKQCLIDTILKGEPMPLFFFNFKSGEDIFYIVDGQQRLNCIRQFYDNNLKLSKKFSGAKLDKKTFNGENALGDIEKTNFLEYELKLHIMENYDDEKVRTIFSRLQRGRPLSLGERLNAKSGSIVPLMRKIADHNFINKSTAIAKRRYGAYPDSARILFYEKFGAKQCGSNELYNFFDNFQNLDSLSKEYKTSQSTLNFLEKCFPKSPGNYKFFEKHAWILAVYTMIRDLKLTHSLINKEELIHNFIKDFHSKIYNEDFRKSNVNYQRFYDNVRGGWSEKIISLRRNILINEFLSKNQIDELDIKRQITDEEKLSLFSKTQQCEMCGIKFKDHKEAEYHHKQRFADGGKTEEENIMLLCNNCHLEIHGKSSIEANIENDYEEIE